MEKMKREKLVIQIICIALATILWFYVSYQENPSMSKTVRNVPLAITGEQALKENGFSVYSLSKQSVDVKVTAKRLSLARITNKTLSAVINVSSIKQSGEYVIPATISATDSSNASFYVKGRDITVIIEPIVEKTFDIEADIAPGDDSSLFVKNYELSSKTVTVSAPESVINDIVSVKTSQIVPSEKNSNVVDDINLIVIGSNGKPLESAQCTPSSIDVTYSFYDVKDVPVRLKTNNGGSFTLPSKYDVTIYGSGSEFNSIDYLETEPIDMQSYSAGKTVKVKLVAQNGCNLASGSSIDVVLNKDFFE